MSESDISVQDLADIKGWALHADDRDLRAAFEHLEQEIAKRADAYLAAYKVLTGT